MLGELRMGVLCVVLGVGTLGCAGTGQVRYVYQDGQSGVIGLPENTSHWPTYYRQHAEELMSKHFPEGFEVVRAEEVDEGSRTLTVNGTNAAEIDTGTSSRILSLGKLGRSSSRTQSDTLKIKECRIVYRKAGPEHAAKRGEYTDQAVWSPTAYIDPNATARRTSETKAGEHHELAKDPKEPPAGGSKDKAEIKAASASASLDCGWLSQSAIMSKFLPPEPH